MSWKLLLGASIAVAALFFYGRGLIREFGWRGALGIWGSVIGLFVGIGGVTWLIVTGILESWP